MCDKQNSDNILFEDAIARLEQIVRMLDGGNVPLDKSLELYEEGVKLVKICNCRLENAEQKIKVLVEKNGEYREEDFNRESKVESN